MTDHVHCQTCGAHYTNRAELDHHCRHSHHQQNQRAMPPDEHAGVQSNESARKDREFTRSPKE